MLVKGEWHVCLAGVSRPTVEAYALGTDGLTYPERFLIDSGADATVFSAEFLMRLGLPSQSPASGHTLGGIGGKAVPVVLRTVLVFNADDGNLARFENRFAALTNPDALDKSLLGRDILDYFDLIIARQQHEIVLLLPNHEYQIV